jgi:hypothetical protein
MQTNNYLKFINTLKEIKGTPKLLLHACCAPCSTFCLERLVGYFDITLYFYNPNITSREEFEKRYIELETFINKVYKLGKSGILVTKNCKKHGRYLHNSEKSCKFAVRNGSALKMHVKNVNIKNTK